MSLSFRRVDLRFLRSWLLGISDEALVLTVIMEFVRNSRMHNPFRAIEPSLKFEVRHAGLPPL